jgi:hypothetical protein
VSNFTKSSRDLLPTMVIPQTGQWRTGDMGGGVIIAPSAGSAARLLMQINIHIGWAPAHFARHPRVLA